MTQLYLLTRTPSSSGQGPDVGPEASQTHRVFEAPANQQDQVRVAVYLLSRLALDPLEIRAVQQMLCKGVVILNYFGVSNPVPHFEVSVGSSAQAQLLAAVEANLGSDRFKAAQRVCRQRQPKVLNRRRRQEDAVVRRLRATLPWPPRTSAADELLHTANAHQLEAKTRDLRDRHQQRMKRLMDATMPGTGSWFSLLDDLAQQVLAPALLH